MIATLVTRQGREIVARLWRWTLLLIIISVPQGRVLGQGVRHSEPSIPIEAIVDAKPIPIPNIDNPNQFRYPYKVINPNEIAVADVLRLNRAGDYQRVIKAWHHLRMMDDSVTWKQLGLGVAYLRLDKLDQRLAFDPSD